MFIERLNKNQNGTYSLEEEKILIDGKWEGLLDHDNVNHSSLTIYTGPKLTGDKVENYFISTPSETPWKTELKIFSDKDKVYVVYESTGDQVDAGNINLLQDNLEDTILDLTGYKQSNNGNISDLKDRATNLEDTRATKTYVDLELNKKYNKEQVFTKEEVLQKIKDLIGTAPEALDTLGKLADALDNDPNFATNIINLLADKVDVVEGKSLTDENFTIEEKNKLAGVEEDANKYKHPASHSANIIVETTDKKFVTGLEKTEIGKVKDKLDTVVANETFATKEEIEGVGTGDMLKSTYDTNNNGKVDISENAEKLGGKLPNQYMKVGPLAWNDLKGV